MEELNENFDKMVLQIRSGKYDRTACFKKMCKKHFLKKCKCMKTNKKCICSGTINLDNFDDEKYIDEIQEQLETLYNICQSVTQSLRSSAGKDFEKCIEHVLTKKKILYSKQVFISNEGIILKKKNKKKGHVVDIMIPPPTYNTSIKEYDGDIISIKTTLRERILQDKFLTGFDKSRTVCISLEKCKDPSFISIQITENTLEFTNYVNTLIERFH
jgi:hypothetical protein